MANFIPSAQGNPMLVDSGGYMYQRHIGRSVTNWYKIAWRCSKHRRGKCPARASTEGNYVVKLIGEHNH